MTFTDAVKPFTLLVITDQRRRPGKPCVLRQ
jgi:hypothetical protein